VKSWTRLAIAVSTLAFATAASAQSYVVVDTGQGKCYDASVQITCPSSGASFYGQDAQYTGHAPSFTLSGDGLTVYDNNTGLTWQHTTDTNGDGVINVSDKLSWANAQARPAVLNAANYGGYNDWRLPTIKELYSLIDFRGGDPSGMTGNDTSGLTPFIDTAYFDFAYGDTGAGERIIDSQYASSTLYVSHTFNDGGNTLFGVNFADGRIKGYGLTMPGGATKTFFVQCVRGNTSYGVNAFVDNGDQTITDNASGLMWSKGDSGTGMNWQAALAWVQTKNAASYLGHSDWRLPDAKESQSILDYTRSPDTTNSAAIDPVFSATSFTNEGGQTDWPWYWTSTTHATYTGVGASAVYIAFGRASGWQKSPPTATCYTLFDVHGAGAQRSDPKTSSGLVTMGTACSGGTAYGLGPQGDAQRAANYIRLVRDAGPAGPTRTPTPTATPTPTVVPTLGSLDHFTCYKAGATRGSIKFLEIQFPPGLLLTDQFGASTVAVKKPRFLCAPTDKNNENPGAELHSEHLQGYQIKSLFKPGFPTNITVIDQLNPAGLRVDAKKQSHLLVPTVKSLTGPAPVPTPGTFAVDHFECYKVRVASKTPKFVPVLALPVTDQFGTMTVDVKKPKFLCNPVDKSGEGITDPVTHLMCYQVKQVDAMKFAKIKGVYVNNQFGPEQLDVKKPSELCIPALTNP
jgi:hypothetical protein